MECGEGHMECGEGHIIKIMCHALFTLIFPNPYLGDAWFRAFHFTVHDIQPYPRVLCKCWSKWRPCFLSTVLTRHWRVHERLGQDNRGVWSKMITQWITYNNTELYTVSKNVSVVLF